MRDWKSVNVLLLKGEKSNMIINADAEFQKVSMFDPYFDISTLQAYTNPNQAVYAAMHQDYSSDPIDPEKLPSERRCGELIVQRLLAGGRGHYGPLEQAQITLNAQYFPHSTMQQLRTHRVGITFDVQSFRYTSHNLIEVAEGSRHLEEVVYLRPVGAYTDRQGSSYDYTEDLRRRDLEVAKLMIDIYAGKVKGGFSEEHARGLIPFDVRQHFVFSVNARSLMHLLDLRWKADAQYECQVFCDLLFDRFYEWMPEVAQWYQKNRAKKARLSP